MNYDALVKAYRNIRDRKAELNKEHEMVIKGLDANLEKLEAVMLKVLNDNQGEGIRTASGTFYREMEIIPSGSDWEAFYEFVKQEDAFDALERRIKRTFIVDYMANNDGDLPPGVSVFRRFKVKVRKNDKD